MMHISPNAPLWLASRVILADRGDDLFHRWELVKKTFGLEEIHDLRVSSRRLREGLALFSSCFPAKNQKRIKSQVKQLTTILGGMRNTDEAILFFSPLLALLTDSTADALQGLVEQLQSERAKEQKALKRNLKELNMSALRKAFVDTCDRPLLFAHGINPFVPIAEYMRTKIEARELALIELLPKARQVENVSAQHRLRIAVKHFRYRCEMATPLVGPELQNLLSSIKQYQEILGKMHDLDVFSAILASRIDNSVAVEPVSTIIAERRLGLFKNFEDMLEATPLETLSTQIRSLL